MESEVTDLFWVELCYFRVQCGKIRMLCFVLITSVLLNLLCIWSLF